MGLSNLIKHEGKLIKFGGFISLYIFDDDSKYDGNPNHFVARYSSTKSKLEDASFSL